MRANWRAFLFALLVPLVAWAGDTGTYRIDDYGVRLSPHANGGVTLEYRQKWTVTSGHIPWMTVGVPNSRFAIGETRGAARSLANASDGGWSGIRIDLDRDYRAGENFEIGFVIEQSGLFYASGDSLKLDFTPGWYDRAGIGQLTVTMNIAAPAGEVKASPAPTTVEGQEIIWVRQNLGPGQRVQFSVAFPKARMPGVQASADARAPGAPWSSANRGHGISPIIIFIIIVIVLILFMRGGIGGGRYARGGTIFYGGSLGSGGGSRRSSSGGGGFGGSSSSCACACVSCACACACAGGGGAGCARKTTHTCPLCRGRKNGRA